MRRKNRGKLYNRIMEKIKRISIFSNGKGSASHGQSDLVPVEVRLSGNESKKPLPKSARVLAALCSFAIILSVAGCGFTKKLKKSDNPAPDPFQQGYQKGVEAGRSAYIDTYGDMIRACVSKNAVEAIYEASQKVQAQNVRLKKQLKGGVKFAKTCLAEQKKLQNALKSCADSECVSNMEFKK